MKYRVFHRNRNDDKYKHVANVDVLENISDEIECLEFCFERTNHIDSNWENNPEVTPIITNNRSTSVGDIIQRMSDNKMWKCIEIGWKVVE